MPKTNSELLPRFITLIVLAVITLLNLYSVNRIGLSVDEAHYVLYGVHLDWSYYDHPPLVGWLQALILPFSDSNLALRLWPIAFNIISSYTLYYYCRVTLPKTSEWVACISVLIWQSALILHILSIALIPQVPFIFFSLLALLQFYRIVALDQKNVWTFITLGLALGFAALSEYTAGLLAIVLIIYIVFSKPSLLINYRLWLAGLITLLCCTPIIYWNYHQHWASLIYQHDHVLNNAAWSFTLFWQSQAGQCLAYAPGIYILGLIVLVRSFLQWNDLTQRLTAITATIWLAFFIYGSGYTFTLPHWTAVGWIVLFPTIAQLIHEHWQSRWLRVTTIISLIYSIILIGFTYIQIFFHPLTFPLGQDPLRDLYGWQRAAQQAQLDLDSIPNNDPNNPPGLFVSNWTLASRMAWYAHAPVQVTGNDHSQFFYWYGNPKANAYGILIVPTGTDAPAAESSQPGTFKRCELKSQLTDFLNSHPVNHFDFYYCRGYQIG